MTKNIQEIVTKPTDATTAALVEANKTPEMGPALIGHNQPPIELDMDAWKASIRALKPDFEDLETKKDGLLATMAGIMIPYAKACLAGYVEISIDVNGKRVEKTHVAQQIHPAMAKELRDFARETLGYNNTLASPDKASKMKYRPSTVANTLTYAAKVALLAAADKSGFGVAWFLGNLVVPNGEVNPKAVRRVCCRWSDVEPNKKNKYAATAIVEPNTNPVLIPATPRVINDQYGHWFEKKELDQFGVTVRQTDDAKDESDVANMIGEQIDVVFKSLQGCDTTDVAIYEHHRARLSALHARIEDIITALEEQNPVKYLKEEAAIKAAAERQAVPEAARAGNAKVAKVS